MKYNFDNNFSFTMDLRDDGGNIWAAVSVIPSKEVGKRDILLMDIKEGNISVRSITELLNLLHKKKVSFDNKKKVVDFLADSLLFLERNER
jgi:hypothetical protein